MKTLNFKSFLLSSLLLAATVSCVEEHYEAPNLDGECVTIPVTKQVSDITSTSTTTYAKYTGDDVIEAYVTSSDESGNFYKSISLMAVDGSVGFSMQLDAYNIFTYYEPGRKVFVKMKDLYYVTENSATVIGGLYDNDTPADTSDDEVGRIAGVDFKNVIQASCTKVNENDIVKHLTINQAKNNQYLNTLIELDGVQFTDASVGKKYFDPSINNLGGATNHEITDKFGNKIILRVSEFASFAANTISGKSGKIRGVLTKFGSTFQFMVRNEQDIKLTNDRMVPLFDEPFTTNYANWAKISVVGAQVWTLNTTFGNPGSCAVMSGFASGNNANEDWLISPAINLSSATEATLVFDNASRFAGNPIEVLVSTNYSGSGAPSAATWTPLSGFILDNNTSAYVWTNSGPVSLNAFVGNANVRVAFKYTSTTTASRTWEIDNVKVF